MKKTPEKGPLLSAKIDTYFELLPKDLHSVKGSFLHKIEESIFKNLNNKNFGAGDLARSIPLSISQLNRRLNTFGVVSAGKLIKSIRLHYAAQLLAQNTGSIGEIAFKTGFNDQAHFCKCFKQSFNCTPSNFKRKYQ